MLDRLASTPLNAAGADYALVRNAIRFISEESRDQPGIEAIADAVKLTPAELTALFRRWAGLTPKAFLQAVTLDHAKRLLDEGLPLLDAALEAGLSGPSRLHDLFVTHEAISPGEYKSGGRGWKLPMISCPRRLALLADAHRAGALRLAFADEGGEQAAFEDMTRRWPRATYVRAPERIAPIAARIFDEDRWRPDQPLRVFLIGTDFEVRVWETLSASPWAARRPMARSPASSRSPVRRGLWALRWGAIPSLSWCPAIALSANLARSPATTGGSRASAPCSAGSGSHGGLGTVSTCQTPGIMR